MPRSRNIAGMRQHRLTILLLLLLSFSSVSAQAANVGSFDLFGFSLSSADQGLGKRAEALGKALIAAFPKELKAGDVKANLYNGQCFNAGADQYKLWWMDSETEGFSFRVEKLKAQKICTSPFTEGMTFKSSALNASQFFPVSRGQSSLQLGVSTPEQVKQALGKPDYANSEKLIYFYKRDKAKEKGCGANSAEGDFYGVSAEFGFSGGVLQFIALNNDIAGEC